MTPITRAHALHGAALALFLLPACDSTVSKHPTVPVEAAATPDSRPVAAAPTTTPTAPTASHPENSGDSQNPDSGGANLATHSMKKRAYTVPPDSELKKILTPLQWKVVREEGTERPFSNDYWDNHREGLYVCIVSGKPLFSSKDKFDSGTGWPSFTKPLEGSDDIVTKEDRKLFSVRTEVRTKTADTHLGHVFDDGPAPTGLRYCMNSAALKFIPKEKLAEEGYGEFAKLFDQNDRTND